MLIETKACINYSLHLSTAKAARARSYSLSPCTVDDWLRVATRRPRVEHLQQGYVICLVEKASFQVRSRSKLITLSSN